MVSLTIFILLFFGGLTLSFSRHPIYGLYAYMTTIYLHPQTSYWGASLPDLRWSLIAAITTLIAIFFKTKDCTPPWYKSFVGIMLAAFAMWMWIQYLWAFNHNVHTKGVILYTKYVILFYIFYKSLDTTEHLKKIIIGHVLGCFYMGWQAYGAYSGSRLEGVGGPGIADANTFGMVMATASLFAAMLLFDRNKHVKLFALCCMPFLLNSVIISGSRGAVVGLVAGGIALFSLTPKKHKKSFVLLGIMGALLLGMLVNDTFINRIATIGAVASEEEELEDSAASRSIIIMAQWEMFKDYPFGGGHKTTAILSPLYLDQKYLSGSPGGHSVRASHNSFMAALVDQGLPGGTIFILIVIWSYTRIKKIRTYAAQHQIADLGLQCAIIGGALTTVFVSGLFSNYLKVEISIWCLSMLSVMYIKITHRASV